VDAIQKMLTGDRWNTTVNLAGGRPVTIETLVREVGEALGVNGVRIDKQGVAHESNQFWGSTGGFTPKIALPDGIRRFRDFLVGARQYTVSPSP
jgi:nucleoside-diphosphate-sugar epimerase